MSGKPKAHRDHQAATQARADTTPARRWQLPHLLALALALLDWRIFFPALMSQDSITQYNQAFDGRYNDWHPPLMAIALHLAFVAGVGLGLVMLAQCVAAV